MSDRVRWAVIFGSDYLDGRRVIHYFASDLTVSLSSHEVSLLGSRGVSGKTVLRTLQLRWKEHNITVKYKFLLHKGGGWCHGLGDSLEMHNSE